MKLTKTEFYSKKELKFFKKHQDLLNQYEKILKKLELDPFEPSLKTHKLNGSLKKFYGCSLTYDYRIVFLFFIKNDEIILLDIGTHDDVY